MRIVYIVSQFPSLTETFIAREIQQVARLGHAVTICALRPQGAKGPQGLVVPEAGFLRVKLDFVTQFVAHFWCLTKRPLSYFSTLWDALISMFRKPSRALHVLYVWISVIWLVFKLRAEQIEYVHSHFLHNEAIATMWLARILEIPYGITSHVASIRHARSLIGKAVGCADVLVGDTEQTLSVYRELFGRDAELIRNGIDLQDLRFAECSGSPAPDGKPVILAVGSLLPPKGFDVLIRACAILRQRGENFRCRIIGEGPERLALARLVEQNQLTDAVDLPGAMAFGDLRQQYLQAAMLVMPSISSAAGSDGLPTVLIEAMSQGIPVVGTNHAGLPDLIRHRHTGLVVEPGNAQLLAECIATYLREPDFRMQMAANGRFRVEKEFNLHANSLRLVDLMTRAAVHAHQDARK